jgi:hypothetical protein
LAAEITAYWDLLFAVQQHASAPVHRYLKTFATPLDRSTAVTEYLIEAALKSSGLVIWRRDFGLAPASAEELQALRGRLLPKVHRILAMVDVGNKPCKCDPTVYKKLRQAPRCPVFEAPSIKGSAEALVRALLGSLGLKRPDTYFL